MSAPHIAFSDLPNLPALNALKARRQWVCWQYEKRVSADGTIVWTKPPVSALTGYKTSVTEAKNWATYQRALDRVLRDKSLAGVGLVLSSTDNLSGGDMDHVRDAVTHEITSEHARRVIEFAETYIEASPSGLGLRIIGLGKIERTFTDNDLGIECYGTGRYLTITGHHIPGTPVEIRPAPRTFEYLREVVENNRVPPLRTQHIVKTPEATEPTEAPEAESEPESGDFFRTVNDRALANLDAWVPVLFPSAKHQGSTRGYRVTSKDLGRNLQEDLGITPQGIKDWGVADMGDPREGRRTPIDLVIEYGGEPESISAGRWLCRHLGTTPEALGWRDETLEIGREATAALLARDDAKKAAAAMRAEAAAKAEAGSDTRPEAPGEPATSEEVKEEPATASRAPTNPLDTLSLGRGVDWTKPAGLLKGVTDWILASSLRPNRPMAVAAATSVLSAVCGRHLYGPTGTALNLYIVLLGGTTVGKGRPLSAPSEILKAAGLGMLATTAKGFSVSAIERMVAERPGCLATADEIGANLLGRMSHRNSSTHETAMRGTFLELWSREAGQAAYATTHSATRQSVDIISPSLTLLGASTFEAFYGAVTSGSVKDGFLNRFLIAEAAPRPRDSRPPDAGTRSVPEWIKQTLLGIVPDGEGNLGGAVSIFSPLAVPTEVRLEWDCEATEERAIAFDHEILDLQEMDGNAEAAPLMGRLFEYTVRLASLHAVSREGRGARVGMRDLEWGAAWAISSVKAMIAGTSANMASSEYEAKFNAVRKTIQGAPGGTITQRELLRQNRSVSASDRDMVLKHLIEAGFIECIDERTTGRPSKSYRWLG